MSSKPLATALAETGKTVLRPQPGSYLRNFYPMLIALGLELPMQGPMLTFLTINCSKATKATICTLLKKFKRPYFLILPKIHHSCLADRLVAKLNKFYPNFEAR